MRHPIFNRCRLHIPGDYLVLLIIYAGFFSVVERISAYEVRTGDLSSKVVRMICIAGALLVSLYLVAKKARVRDALRPTVAPMLLFCAICFLSVPFSMYPPISIVKSVEIFQAVLLCVLAISMSNKRPAAFLQVNIVVLFILVCVILLESVLFPGLAWTQIKGGAPFLSHMLWGVVPALNANTVGLISGLVASASIAMIYGASVRRKMPYIILAASGTALLLSYSRSSILACGGAAFVALVMGRKYAHILVLSLLMLLLMFYVPALGDTVMGHMKRGQTALSAGEILEVGRGGAWKEVWDVCKTNVVGYGFWAGFQYPQLASRVYGHHAHNSFLQLLADLGWLGVFAWALMVGSVVWTACTIHIRRAFHSNEDRCLIFTLLTYLLVKTLFHSSLTNLGYDFLVLVGIIVYLEKARPLSPAVPCGRDARATVPVPGQMRATPCGPLWYGSPVSAGLRRRTAGLR